MVSLTLLAFMVLLATAVLVWRQDRRTAIHLLPKYGVVLIACLSLALALQHVLGHPVEGSAVAGFVLTSVLLSAQLPDIKRVVVYVAGAVLVLVTPVSPLVAAVAGVGLLVAVPLKLLAPDRNPKRGGHAVHPSID